MRRTFGVGLALCAGVLCGWPGAAKSDEVGRTAPLVTVRPVDTGVALENPGMGWVFHHYDNTIAGYGAPLGPTYTGSEFPGLTVAYLRLAWSYLEPEEGRFRWSVVDTPAQRYIAAGKRIAISLTCYEGDPNTPNGRYATPEWVRKAGAKGTMLEKECWEPDYDDPVFLAKLERFLKAAGARYDGNPNVAFVDVATLGIWGEGHPIARQYGVATVKRHIDIHRRCFPRTLLAAQDDFSTWFADGDLRKPGTTRAPMAFMLPADAAGKQYDVFVGLWSPGDTTRPDARLAPAVGGPDRRVAAGRLTVAADGTPTFVPIRAQERTGGEYAVRVGGLSRAGRRQQIDATWDVRVTPPPAVTPFMHFDRDGKIAFSGWNMNCDTTSIQYARSVGCTLRDDSILVEPAPSAYYSDWLAKEFWPSAPVIIESGHYGYAKQIKAWGDGGEYLKAVEDYHASYVSIHADPHEFLAENGDLIRRMNLRIGYRLSLAEASWPETVASADGLEVSASWRNAGVAPCLPGGYPAYWLFGDKGQLLATLVDDATDVRALPVGPPGQAKVVTQTRRFALPPDLPAGVYEVRVSVGDRDGTPRIALPLPGDDGRRRYRLGAITVTK